MIIQSPRRQGKCTKFAEKYFLSQKRYYLSKELKNHLDDLVLGSDFPVLCCLGIIPLASKVAGDKGISEVKSKQQSPCSNCMHRHVMSQVNACTSQAYACMYCMNCPMMSQANSCSYCMGSVVLISSWIFLYLQLLWLALVIFSYHL